MDRINYATDRIATLTAFCRAAGAVRVICHGDAEYPVDDGRDAGSAAEVFGADLGKLVVFADQSRAGDGNWTLVGVAWDGESDRIVGGLVDTAGGFEIHVDTLVAGRVRGVRCEDTGVADLRA